MNSNHFPQNEKIGFLRKTTLVDFPEHIACAVFLIGCNLRCPYCYNKDLVLLNKNSQKDDFSTLDEVFKHLELRKNVLSGITISGGEPLLHPATPLIIKYAKKLGYKIKLDTNGTNPSQLEKLIKNDELCPDYVAMDIKTSPNRYKEELLSEKKSNNKNFDSLLNRTIELIENNKKIITEYRTVLVPHLITKNDIEAIASILPQNAIWMFSNFENFNCLNPKYNNILPFTNEETIELVEHAKKIIKNATLR